MENMNVTEERHKSGKRKGRGLRQEVSEARCTRKRREMREGDRASTGKSRAVEKEVRERGRTVTGRAKGWRGA